VTSAATGALGSYAVTATVTGTGLFTPAPSGSVSFVDTSNGNAVVAMAPLGSGASTIGLLNPAETSIGHETSTIAVGDFNGDGIPDVVVTDEFAYTVGVWLGNGDGTFRSADSLATGENPVAIAVADFNGDGNLDLALLNYGTGSDYSNLTILLGKGDGTFTDGPASPAVDPAPRGVITGDFNGDGIPDLAVGAQDAINVLLGKGDGSFIPAYKVSFPTDTNSNPFIVAGDFNGDGKLDFATFILNPDELIVALGKGDGTFPTQITTSVPFQTSDYQTFMAVADLNGDGIPDLVASVDSKATVLLGAGNGTFTVGKTLELDQAASSYRDLTIGDFNGDGIPDVAGFDGSKMSFFLGVGDGTFTNGPSFDGDSLSPDFTFGSWYGGLISADLNGDGLTDVVAIGYSISLGTGQLVPLLSTPASMSIASASITLGTGNHLVEASYSGDTNYTPSVSSTTTLAGPDSTTLSLALSKSPPDVYGETLVLSATLSPYSGSGYSTNGELVSFYNSSRLLGTASLAGGVATLTLNSLDIGSYSFSTSYAGDGRFLASSSSSIQTTIVPATPTINWAAPSAITYGMALGAAQLNATASVPGIFTYSPASGTVPGAGMQKLSVTFTPVNTTDYTNATASVTLKVNPATPSISWAAPSTITYGTALSAAQLNATASVPGTFAYGPSAGTIPGAGTQTLSVTFTPTDTTDYTNATASVTLKVNRATSSISWAGPATIAYGTALSAAQLDAKASVPGAFTYSPAAGTILGAGTQILLVTFTPADTSDYTTATAAILLTVNKATPAITWTRPNPITYGTPLTSTQLDATATTNRKAVDGTYTYSPKAGTELNAGINLLTVKFVPRDSSNYKEATFSVDLTVEKATQKIDFAKIENQTYTPDLTIALKATSGASREPVVFSLIEGASRASITGHKLKIKAAGSFEVAANQAGDANYFPAAEATQKLAVTQASQTIEFKPPSSATKGSTVTLRATASSGLTVSFAVSGPATLTGNSLKFSGTGTVTVTASQKGSLDYAPARSVSKTITVSSN
jgi:hypothetical protein